MHSAQHHLRTQGYYRRPAAVGRERCRDLTQALATAAGPVAADESVRLEDPAGEVIAAVLEEDGLRGLVTELLGPSWVLVTNRHNHAVIDHGGHPVAAVAITFATQSHAARTQLADATRQAAATLTARIGGRVA